MQIEKYVNHMITIISIRISNQWGRSSVALQTAESPAGVADQEPCGVTTFPGNLGSSECAESWSHRQGHLKKIQNLQIMESSEEKASIPQSMKNLYTLSAK